MLSKSNRLVAIYPHSGIISLLKRNERNTMRQFYMLRQLLPASLVSYNPVYWVGVRQYVIFQMGVEVAANTFYKVGE